MTTEFPFSQFTNPDEPTLEVQSALLRILTEHDVSLDQLASELGITSEEFNSILDGDGANHIAAWLRIPDRLVEVLRRYGVLPDDASRQHAATLSSAAALPVPAHEDARSDGDPFAGNADDVAAEETRRKAELFRWADGVLNLTEAELQLELDEGVRRFSRSRQALMRIIRARRNDRDKTHQSRRGPQAEHPGEGVRFYGSDFKVSDRGVSARRFDKEGDAVWEKISSTPIDLEALTRDARGENWGTYLRITNRDGGVKRLAIPHALTAADKTAEIAALLASLGVGIVPSRVARQLIVQFLTQEVKARITSVPQIGWHASSGTWVFVLPDETLVPKGLEGAQPVLQTPSLQTQTGLDVGATVADWIEQIATPLAGNSNVHLCVGTAFAGPLLYWANEPPGFFHVWGTSKIAKSLAAAIGQSVWGRPKVPGEADAFGASWTATAVGLERYAVLRSDIGGSFDEIGEGDARVIRNAVYVLANGSTKLRGTQDMNLRQMESFRILGISTGEPTMESFLSAAGEKVPAGLTVRLVDVPAEVQPESAFETCPVDRIEELGKRFYPLTTQLYGAVGRAWLQHLVDLGPDEIQARLRRHREEWLALPAIAAVRVKATGQVRSVINRFALIASALRMAIDAGLLPWTPEDTDLGVAACMTRWATSRKGRLDLAGEMVSAVEQIRAILASDLHGRFIHLHIREEEGCLDYVSGAGMTKRDTLGYVKDGRILVDPSAWRTELCAGFDPEKTARHLRSEGLLIADEGKLQRKEKIVRGGEVVGARFYVLDMRILEDKAGTGPRETSS